MTTSTTQLLSYHNDAKVKDKYLARLRGHREADRLVQGVGWESNGKTRGCAVGCTLGAYDHDRYPVELGIPVELAHLEDAIFENLPRERALQWPEAFLGAIPVGVNLDRAVHRIKARILREIGVPAVTVDRWGVVDACNLVAILHEMEARGEAVSVDRWSAAESAARSAASAAESAASAAESAASAAESAARSAASAAESDAWSAAESAARSAASAASSAAWSAASAAWSAAWLRIRDMVLEELARGGDAE